MSLPGREGVLGAEIAAGSSAAGKIFDISRACVDDGPGLRTVLFFKGCALSCPWCHNPEGRSPGDQLALDGSRCIGCGQCQQACERQWSAEVPGQWRLGCTACGRCARACPARARRLVGQRYTAAALAEEAARDMDFFAGTGGGVSFSGGEPLAQPTFALDCARELKERGVHLALETSGHWPTELANQVGQTFDLVLLDLKHVDGEKLRACGADVGLVLQNLRRLMASPARVQLRLTLVPGFNDAPGDLRQIAARLRERPPVAPITLLPFHRLARAKEALLDRDYPYADAPPTSPKELAAAQEVLAAEGLEAGAKD